MATKNLREVIYNGPYKNKRKKILLTPGQQLTVDANGNLTGSADSGTSTDYTSSGAIAVADGLSTISVAGVGAMTLVGPTAGAQDGLKMTIMSTTANAHTVTYTAGFNAGGTSTDVATFGGAKGDNMVIVASNGVWLVQTLRNVTLG